MRMLIFTITCIFLLQAGPALSWYPKVPNQSLLPEHWQGNLIGRDSFCLVDQGTSLTEIALWEGLGYQNLVAANPDIDPWLPTAGTNLLLPYATLLPIDAQPGITINLAEFRLYLIWQQGDYMRVRVYPIGLGRESWDTPEGDFHVTMVIDSPTWVRPESMRGEEPDLPNVIDTGPNNPLGSHWIALSAEGYGIHGTNRPFGVGRRVSHGCIRLYPQDIIDLARRVEPGMPVRIVYRPIKVGIDGNKLLLEVHDDFLGRVTDPLAEIRQAAAALGWRKLPNDRELLPLLNHAKGGPTEISRH